MDKLKVQADIAVGSRGNPTVTNTLRNMAEVTTCSVAHTENPRCCLGRHDGVTNADQTHAFLMVQMSAQCLCHTWCILLRPKGHRPLCIILLLLTALQAVNFSIRICAGCTVFKCMALPWYRLFCSACSRRQFQSCSDCMFCILQTTANTFVCKLSSKLYRLRAIT